MNRQVLDCANLLALSIRRTRRKAAEDYRTPRRWRADVVALRFTVPIRDFEILEALVEPHRTESRLRAAGLAMFWHFGFASSLAG